MWGRWRVRRAALKDGERSRGDGMLLFCRWQQSQGEGFELQKPQTERENQGLWRALILPNRLKDPTTGSPAL